MIEHFKVGHTYDVTVDFEGLKDPDTKELSVYRVTVSKIVDRDSAVTGYIEGDYISRGIEMGNGRFYDFQIVNFVEVVEEENEPYDIDRDQLAQMVAAHLSGLRSANPESVDFELADSFIKQIEMYGETGRVPRVRG